MSFSVIATVAFSPIQIPHGITVVMDIDPLSLLIGTARSWAASLIAPNTI